MWFGLSSDSEALENASRVPEIPWVRNDKGHFRRLVQVDGDDPELAGSGGVAVFFHRGVRPGGVCVTAADDLGGMMKRALADPEVAAFEDRGGLFVTWAFVKPEYRDGIVAYLRGLLVPEIAETALDGWHHYEAEPIPVRPPH